jgi:flagellin
MHLLAKEEITMAMVVKNNMSAVNTLNTLNKNQSALGKSLAKVSSGQKINSAQDDASGFAISERMRVMVRALDQATQNTQNGSAMMKVAEGAVANTVEILKTLKEKAINAATDTNTDDDRKTIQKEIDQFIDQINDNALATFNGKYLVDGSKGHKVVSNTATVLLNQSLDVGSSLSTMFLTGLKDTAGNSLNIVDGDTIKVSWVIQGKTFSTSDMTVSSTGVGNVSTLANILSGLYLNSKDDIGKVGGFAENNPAGASIISNGTVSIGKNSSGVDVYTPNGKAGIIFTGASAAGLAGQISGFTITVTDQYGNAKKSANERLEFKTEIFAANKQDNDQSLKIHVGAAAGQTISIGLLDMRAEALGLQNAKAETIKVATPEKANAAIAAFDSALQKALDHATTIGAIEARLEYTANNLTTSSENVQAAESTIRDADMAKEMTNYTKNNVLLQAAQSMLAQANQNSSAVLSLLQ